MIQSGLAWPPKNARDLDGFPRAHLRPRTLHRLSEHPGVWWYSAADGRGGGRFDLVLPNGTCYLADHLDGALTEKLLRRPKRILSEQRLRELNHARVRIVRKVVLADMTSGRATGFGINAEIHTTLDYAKPRAWAARLHAWGARGIRYLVRTDPAARLRGIGLFGRAGLHARAPAGMRTAVGPLDVTRARRVLERRGVQVLPIPRDVAVVDSADL